jgi:hypothetical protein
LYESINFTNSCSFKIGLQGELAAIESKLKVTIVRDAKVRTEAFLDYFKGFEELEAVRRIFGQRTDEVLANLRVEFAGRRGYMGVSETDGHLIISADYLSKGDIVDIYLDIIHELVHIRQFMEGKELFDHNYEYIERPTEIEAYRCAVEEAKRLGLSDKRICEYLKTEWMSDDDLRRLAKAVYIKCGNTKEKEKE